MKKYQMYIAGKFTGAKSGKTKAIINPATGESYATVPDCQADDVDAAVRAARKAFDHGEWRKVTAQARGKLLLKLSQAIFDHADELTKLEVENNGKPKR